MDADSPTDVRLTDTQLGILAALCRPISVGNHFATPSTNQEIADEVFLSVDAVKGHLRTLYRKFGIEDLPHNQKRARLVELAVEGGYLVGTDAEGPESGTERRSDPRSTGTGSRTEQPPDSGRAAGPDTEQSASAPPPERARSSPRLLRARMNSPALWGFAAVVGLAAVAAALAIAGVFSSGSSDAKAPAPAAFRTKVAGYCKLARAGAPTAPTRNRVERAQGYLEVIETMRGRFESLTPPAAPNVALERFGAGLTTAANYTSAVAESPPPAGSGAEARDVAELTFAAGQVQAGAVGYGLGRECSAIGDLVARSAENAAAP